MDEPQKIDLRKYQSPRLKRRHTIRILVYTVFVIGILVYLWYRLEASRQSSVPVREEEIEGVEIGFTAGCSNFRL